MDTPEFYKRFYDFSQQGYSVDDARTLAKSSIDVEDYERSNEYINDDNEYRMDLIERGFFFGTDDPVINERIERAEIFQDKMDMYMNEY